MGDGWDEDGDGECVSNVFSSTSSLRVHQNTPFSHTKTTTHHSSGMADGAASMWWQSSMMRIPLLAASDTTVSSWAPAVRPISAPLPPPKLVGLTVSSSSTSWTEKGKRRALKPCVATKSSSVDSGRAHRPWRTRSDVSRPNQLVPRMLIERPVRVRHGARWGWRRQNEGKARWECGRAHRGQVGPSRVLLFARRTFQVEALAIDPQRPGMALKHGQAVGRGLVIRRSLREPGIEAFFTAEQTHCCSTVSRTRQ